MREFFSASVGIPFEPFGGYHLLVLGITVLAVAAVGFLGARIRSWRHERQLRYTLGVVGILFELSLHAWQVGNGIWTYADSMPVALCFLSLVLGIVVMFTRSYAVFEVGYFWAIGGVASILFPDIPYGPDRFRFYQFLFSHLTFFVMFVYMVSVHRYHPTFRSFQKALLYLVLIVFLFVLPLDWLTNANFLFLVRSDGTPFELFEGHGYPLYLCGVVSLSIAVMFAWYLPVHFWMRGRGTGALAS